MTAVFQLIAFVAAADTQKPASQQGFLVAEQIVAQSMQFKGAGAFDAGRGFSQLLGVGKPFLHGLQSSIFLCLSHIQFPFHSRFRAGADGGTGTPLLRKVYQIPQGMTRESLPSGRGFSQNPGLGTGNIQAFPQKTAGQRLMRFYALVSVPFSGASWYNLQTDECI